MPLCIPDREQSNRNNILIINFKGNTLGPMTSDNCQWRNHFPDRDSANLRGYVDVCIFKWSLQGFALQSRHQAPFHPIFSITNTAKCSYMNRLLHWNNFHKIAKYQTENRLDPLCTKKTTRRLYRCRRSSILPMQVPKTSHVFVRPRACMHYAPKHSNT